MKIAIIGYGKMGKTIEQIAIDRGHEIILKITAENREELTAANIRQATVAIEFTTPEAAKDNVLFCLNAGVPVVSGSTGWNDRLEEATAAAIQYNTSFLHASNFSIGVNIFFEINQRLAKLINKHDGYQVKIEETHHTEKKDAPSGTAITAAEQILKEIPSLKNWELQTEKPVSNNHLPIQSFREENVPGTHKVQYTSAIDDIEIIHTAHNRQGFALGAVLAAEFIADKKGIFTIKDVLGLKY